MKIEQIINTNEVEIGDILVLKDGKKAKIKGFMNSMLPTINQIYLFKTDIGDIKPNEVAEIIGGE